MGPAEPHRPDRLAELLPARRPPAELLPARRPPAERRTPIAQATPATTAVNARASLEKTPRTARAQRKRTHAKPRTTAPPNRPRTRPRPVPQGNAGDGGVIGFAMAQVGKGYRYGSTGPDRFDCSGLVVAAYRRIGVNLPRSTSGLVGRGRPVTRAELRPGDLVFPSSGHVGIYIGGGRMVHASTERGGVKVSPIYSFRTARRPLA
ncbi:C40 family peptidase [Dactylosporangium sp. AC04546]|uniref:C40 family peptidase n=1 Tax=Dactylosporangium sp. AC04546 TaxID=2862460 RepID=UPI001EE004B8|nr:C40 family peptidase [Dactylosporangium sp. AC04546]WVK85549.1 C40 family peptidase [Dactylosporangium sp. AC04546]